MNPCKCIRKMEESLKARAADPEMRCKLPKGCTVLSAHAKGWALTSKSGWVFQIPFTVSTVCKGKSKDVLVRVIASHCPFCGAKFEKEGE